MQKLTAFALVVSLLAAPGIVLAQSRAGRGGNGQTHSSSVQRSPNAGQGHAVPRGPAYRPVPPPPPVHRQHYDNRYNQHTYYGYAPRYYGYGRYPVYPRYRGYYGGGYYAAPLFGIHIGGSNWNVTIGSVVFQTPLLEASVYVDGVYVGIAQDFTSRPLDLMPGQHLIELRHYGQTYPYTVSVAGGQVVTIR